MDTTTLTALRRTLADNAALADTPTQDDGPGVEVRGAACDSRSVEPGDLFVCKGVSFRPEFLQSALAAGAVAYLCAAEKADELAAVAPGVPRLVASDLRRAMALVSAQAFGRPDLDLPIVGITGTKGKTTCAYMLRSIVDAAHGAGSCGLMGTVETYDGVEDRKSVNTTPEAPELWRHLAHARGAGLASLVMEVSSQALKYDRTLGVEMAAACFLNIGLDHISDVEHRDFEDYLSSKLKIFSQCRTAVVNLDSDHVGRILGAARNGSAERVITFGVERPEADVWADSLAPSEDGISFTLHLAGEARGASLPFPGTFSVSDALCAAVAADLLGIGIDAIVEGLGRTRVPGRMERYRTADRRVTAFVDYAHNRLAFESLLSAISGTFAGARVIAVFGAVGGKAVERRHDLPEVAARYVDHIILTADDPWTEDPLDICRQMEESLPQGFSHQIEVDREKAVGLAFDLARTHAEKGGRCVVLLLAKGADATQHTARGWEPIASDSELAARLVAAYDADLPR